MKECLYCAEQIQDNATLCRFCNREQVPPAAKAPSTIFSGHIRHRTYLGSYCFALLVGGFAVALFFWRGALAAPHDDPYVIAAAVNAGLALLLLIHRYLRTVSERWTIDSLRIEYSRGILITRSDVLELWRVKDLIYTRTLGDRLFGDGRIELITTDSTDPDLVLRGLPDSRRIYEALRDAVDASRRQRRLMTIEE